MKCRSGPDRSCPPQVALWRYPFWMTSGRTAEASSLARTSDYRVSRALVFSSHFHMEDTATSSAHTSYLLALDANADGTHRFSEVWISPAAVIRCFGPGSTFDDYKISREWRFRKGELIFTLYDWKSTNLYDSQMWSPVELWASEEPFPLHIGSKAPATHDDAKEFARFLCETTGSAE